MSRRPPAALRTLSLSNNRITDRGAQTLALGLGLNSVLQELLLDGNALGPAALAPLLAAVNRRAAFRDAPAPTAISLFDNSGFGDRKVLPDAPPHGAFFEGDIDETTAALAAAEANAKKQLKLFDTACTNAAARAVAARSLLHARHRRCNEEQAARTQALRDETIARHKAAETLKRDKERRSHEAARWQRVAHGGAAAAKKKADAAAVVRRRLGGVFCVAAAVGAFGHAAAEHPPQDVVDPEEVTAPHQDGGPAYQVSLQQLLAFYATHDPSKSRAEVKHVHESWPPRALVEGLLDKYGDDPRRFGNSARARRFEAAYAGAACGGTRLPMLESVASTMSTGLEPLAAAASKAARGRAPQKGDRKVRFCD